MAMRLFIALFVRFLVTNHSVNGDDATDCFNKPCSQHPGGETCFTSGCQRVGLQTVCQLTSTSALEHSIKEPRCTDPYMVPGFVQFCYDVIDDANRNRAPGPVYKPDGDNMAVTSTLKPMKDEKVLELSPDEPCYGPTVLVSIAVGSFVGGCSVTLILLCCCKVFTPCAGRRKGTVETFSEDTREVWHTHMRSREMGSTSTALLLPNSETTQGHPPLPATPTTGDYRTAGAPWAHNCSLPGFSSRSYQLGNPVTIGTDVIPTSLEPIYNAASEASSRDYQSIQGSENPYSVQPEYNDYMVAMSADRRRGGQDPSTSADYMCLEGNKEERTYYPAGEGSNKDYTSLAGDIGDTFDDVSYPEQRITGGEGKSRGSAQTPGNVRFSVNGLQLPTKRTAAKQETRRANSNEYDSLEGRNAAATKDSRQTSPDITPNITIADTATREETETSNPVHEYFILEPM